MNKAFLDLQKGLALYKVWIYQAYHEISAKYRHTFLGSLWIAGGMVTTSLCLSLIFGIIQGQDLKTVLPHIMGGILAYTMISFILIEGAEVFISAGGIIKNHAYPFTYYVFEGVTRSFLTFLHNLIVFYIAIALVGELKIPNWEILLGLPIVLVTMFTWGTFVGMMASRFRDLRFMMPYLSQLVFFLTPIFWSIGPNAKGWRSAIVADYNPFYGLVEVIRAPLLGQAPSVKCWTLALVAMTSGILVWMVMFTLFRRRIPFWV